MGLVFDIFKLVNIIFDGRFLDFLHKLKKQPFFTVEIKILNHFLVNGV